MVRRFYELTMNEEGKLTLEGKVVDIVREGGLRLLYFKTNSLASNFVDEERMRAIRDNAPNIDKVGYETSDLMFGNWVVDRHSGFAYVFAVQYWRLL